VWGRSGLHNGFPTAFVLADKNGDHRLSLQAGQSFLSVLAPTTTGRNGHRVQTCTIVAQKTQTQCL
jgi:hypothetical protein